MLGGEGSGILSLLLVQARYSFACGLPVRDEKSVPMNSRGHGFGRLFWKCEVFRVRWSIQQ